MDIFSLMNQNSFDDFFCDLIFNNFSKSFDYSTPITVFLNESSSSNEHPSYSLSKIHATEYMWA